jgi:hypothetical protein
MVLGEMRVFVCGMWIWVCGKCDCMEEMVGYELIGRLNIRK